MKEMKQIHDFAVKWCDKFRDQNINYIELVDHWMADDCAALGFEMDYGHAFSERYGQAANNHEALDSIIDDVTDHLPAWVCNLFSMEIFQPLGI